VCYMRKAVCVSGFFGLWVVMHSIFSLFLRYRRSFHMSLYAPVGCLRLKRLE
jgi:hypothetical protein